MIYINIPTQQDRIIQLLEDSNEEIKFQLENKSGIKLTFKVSTQDLDEAISLAKKIIKEDEVGRNLYYQVTK